MKKDVLYSMRMNSAVMEALKRAAQSERRSVASLIDKLIIDYLEQRQFIAPTYHGSDQRRFPRKKITLPAISVIRDEANGDTYPCVLVDISMGGALVIFAKGAEIKTDSNGKLPPFDISFKIPRSGRELNFNCNAWRLNDIDNEVHVGAIFDQPSERDLQMLRSYLQ